MFTKVIVHQDLPLQLGESDTINSVQCVWIPSMQTEILFVSPVRSLMFRQACPETDTHVCFFALLWDFFHTGWRQGLLKKNTRATVNTNQN